MIEPSGYTIELRRFPYLPLSSIGMIKNLNSGKRSEYILNGILLNGIPCTGIGKAAVITMT
jgi:hypothetical protein